MVKKPQKPVHNLQTGPFGLLRVSSPTADAGGTALARPYDLGNHQSYLTEPNIVACYLRYLNHVSLGPGFSDASVQDLGVQAGPSRSPRDAFPGNRQRSGRQVQPNTDTVAEKPLLGWIGVRTCTREVVGSNPAVNLFLRASRDRVTGKK